MVYVDEAIYPYRNMRMCHMIADTRQELLEMVDKIGVQRKWIQKAGTHHEHFDICATKRELAVAAGAKQVTSRELVRIMRQKEKACDITDD